MESEVEYIPLFSLMVLLLVCWTGSLQEFDIAKTVKDRENPRADETKACVD
jgi:hypothetical protein